MTTPRLQDIQRFYQILAELEQKLGGMRVLAGTHGRMDWPQRGVYLFFESDQVRSTSGSGLRVMRVGTHALVAGSQSTLWGRLRQHRGTEKGASAGGGNHRGSVFRLHVGAALANRDHWSEEIAGEWGVGSNATPAVRRRELPLERAVSQYVTSMPFLWLAVDDPPGPGSLRGYIERNAIALLSNRGSGSPVDPVSETWLGRWSQRSAIRESELWNVNHVDDSYERPFLDVLQRLVQR